ncbi:BREX-5 system adenine-specific DNA-methyltransferase PglX [Natrinema sp. HArc-T2]|uniref:BREX-5 system adenine-specific DNA-methyltransferase PglX n=1 Tax=Natrinema sp. HArc-T2 TaxID=3242701 RepID=UPI00359CE47E
MDGQSTQPRKAQLDKEEREHLEDIVTEMRDRVEANVRYQLEDEHGLDEKPGDDASLSEEQEDLVEAIELEAVDGNDWDDGYEQYITSVGYTIVNRLAALRCMEVRDFIDDEVTAFRDDGLTPAADRLVTEEFMLEEEAVLEAYRNACDDLAEEIDILFDRSTAYSQIDPDDDTFEDLCEMLDEVPDEVWRADDVLGWVYEYYNVDLLEDLRRKGNYEGLEPEEVPPANQFYTPHWVVRMLTDNSLGKLYLEDTGELQDVIDTQDSLTLDERKNRTLSPDESPNIADFCTYLVPSEEEGEPPEFDSPKDIRVIDPACGSGHFLLYAFDILERIWRTERPEMDFSKIPEKILRYNLYGVDLDLRACQLTSFSLYLKARTRSEAEGKDNFQVPQMGIVCADSKIADIESAEEVFEDVAGEQPKVREALHTVLEAFEDIHGLGSLLDVRGTLAEQFEGGKQLTLNESFDIDHSLSDFLQSLQDSISEYQEEDSFLAQDLKSFIRLLEILSLDYDVSLMNPPYGSKNRMPDVVQDYVETRYEYTAEYYLNFFEVCDGITKQNGRIGMLVPWSFMFRQRFRDFREDFIGEKGEFDFLAEFGYGILDNATVGTVGTVIQTGTSSSDRDGTFLRLHDIEPKEKEEKFLEILSETEGSVKRIFNVDLDEFSIVPRNPICYSIPREVRNLHKTESKIDAKQAGIDGTSICTAIPGLQTSNDARFSRFHWEVEDFRTYIPISKGGENVWLTPKVVETVEWGENGTILKRSGKSIRTRNEEMYGKPGLTWNYIKRTGRRFGYFPGGLFSNVGFMLFPLEEMSLWKLMAVINSNLYHCLMLSQTTERTWNAGDIGSLPWPDKVDELEGLEDLSKEQYKIKIQQRSNDPTSPFYRGPDLLPSSDREFLYQHPHIDEITSLLDVDTPSLSYDQSISDLVRESEKRDLKRRHRLENLADQIDNTIYNELGISEETRDDIYTEIFLRTAEDPEDREVADPNTITGVPEHADEKVKQLVHHFALKVLQEVNDGIVPIESTNGEKTLLEHIVTQFQNTYGEYAEDRLVEVDEMLGTETAAEENYPNLRSFINDDLFEYHVDTMEHTPVLWKISTKRLLADAKGEGFACFVDFHQLDAGLFDRLSNKYLEPRKAELRERRSAANRRQNDESLSTSERAEATEEFEFCSSALEQIAELEEVMQELGSTSERDFDEDDRGLVEELAPKVATFREETADRIETLTELRERNGEEWFQDTFSDNFWDAIDEWRNEWLGALNELEHACEEYAKPSDEPVEAHLADLFDYFNWRLKGTDHYSSTGILFMTYYFEREGADLLNEDGVPFENLTDEEWMLASLATGVDDASVIDDEYLQQIADDEDVDVVDELPPLAEFKALAEEIDDRCQTVDKQIPSDWSDRALSEITTAGYQPVHKHGVAINITPLAEKDIVPEVVEDKVL